MQAWWTENGGMAIGGYNPLEWAKKVNRQSAGTELQSLTYDCCVQLSLREAEACAEHKKFMEQFVEDLIYIEESRLMQYEDGHYLVAMRRERSFTPLQGQLQASKAPHSPNAQSVAAPPHAKSLAKLRRALKDRNAARARGEDPFDTERPASVGAVAVQLMASVTTPPAFSPNKVHEQVP